VIKEVRFNSNDDKMGGNKIPILGVIKEEVRQILEVIGETAILVRATVKVIADHHSDQVGRVAPLVLEYLGDHVADFGEQTDETHVLIVYHVVFCLNRFS